MAGESTIEEELDIIAGRLNAEHGRLVDIAVRLLADRSLWIDWESRSVERFLAWRCGITHGTATKIVQVARRVDDLPLCIAAFRDGLLSLDQVSPIAKRVPWYADEEICRQAQMMTVGQITRTASRYPFDRNIAKPDGSVDGVLRPEEPTATDGDASTGGDASTADDDEPTGDSAQDGIAPDDADDMPTPDRVAFWWDDDGRFRLFADLDAATGSIVENALTEARDSLFRQHDDQSIDWADALREVCERSLDAIETTARRNRFRVHVHVETNGATTTATGCGVADHVADYLTCDAITSEVYEVDGIPISVGRTQRTVPERTRQTVIHRDGGCRVPGCGDHRWLDVHHIVHWAKGGPTDTSNLIALCRHHHRQHHKGRLHITGNADDVNGVQFVNVHGRPIEASGARPRPPGDVATTDGADTRYTPALRERLESRWQHFNLPPSHRPRWNHETQRVEIGVRAAS